MKRLTLLSIITLCSTLAACSSRHYGGGDYKVATQHLNLRVCPDTECRVIDTLDDGDRLSWVSSKDQWIEVRSGLWGTRGWVHKGYLRNLEEKENFNSPRNQAPSRNWYYEDAPSARARFGNDNYFKSYGAPSSSTRPSGARPYMEDELVY